MLGVPFHPPAAARACHDKYLARQLYQAAGLRVPGSSARRWPRIRTRSPAAHYPCVLKPLGLSASRGVIRANDRGGIRGRVPPHRARSASEHVQVESYIPGREFAVEGLVTAGDFSRSPSSISPIRWKGRSSRRPST